jgi:hypothetical protein
MQLFLGWPHAGIIVIVIGAIASMLMGMRKFSGLAFIHEREFCRMVG